MAVLGVSVPGLAAAAPVVIDFERLDDLEAVTTQFSGVTFEHAIALIEGISLNELETPPRSGVTAIGDEGGAIRIVFSVPVSSIGAYLTYAVPVLLEAFGPGHVPLGRVSTLFTSNLALSGDAGSSPNEPLWFSAQDIASVVFAGDPLGGSFILDDLTFTPSQVPEPGSGLLALGIVLAIALRRPPALGRWSEATEAKR